MCGCPACCTRAWCIRRRWAPRSCPPAKLDKTRFPNAQVVVKGNLVGVVAPTEWEAIRAAQQVAGDTKWTDWKGLPGNANLFNYLREERRLENDAGHEERQDQRRRRARAGGGREEALRHLRDSVHEARADRTDHGRGRCSSGRDGAHLHAQPESPGAARRNRADARHLDRSTSSCARSPAPGHYGRSNGGNAGAEDEAVILSKAVGKPVRVQWMRPEDFQWSTQSPAAFSDVEIGLDANGKMVAYQVDHYMPAMQDDRPVGAVLAGLPTMPAPSEKGVFVGSTVNDISDPWVYDGVANLMERGHGTFQVGQKASPLAIGLRDHSMRTPGQFQQNFPRELAISEAAALAGVDAIQFRIDHAKEERVIGVLKAVREASGWETRPSPQRQSCVDRRHAGARPGRFGDVPLGNLLGVRVRDRRYSRHGRDRGGESTRSR